MWRRLGDEERGIGVVTALMVTFIVFSLGAVWYGLSVHELDEVTFDRHRTQALHAADAGAREAMYLLARTDPTTRNAANGAGQASSSPTGTTCSFTALETLVDGTPQTVGEYWFRITDVTPSDTTDLAYFIESWGWAPRHDARQSSPKKVELEVTLFPQEGFEYAMFADVGGLAAGQRKEIYGDIYSAGDLVLDNHTDLYDNGSFPGDGNLQVYGNLTIQSGANTYIEGTVTVNGYIDDQHAGDNFVGDVIAVLDGPGLDASGNDAYFKKATVGGVVRLGGTIEPTSNINGSTPGGPLVQGATGLEPVPLRGIPDFTWDKNDYSPQGSEWSSANFKTWYEANQALLSGAHYVAGDYTWDLKDAQFEDDFLLAVEGDLTIRGNASLTGTALPPVEVVVVGNRVPGTLSAGDPGSKVTLAQSFLSTNDLRFLVYSKGQFAAENLTTVYGTIYAREDVSSNKLIVHYRRPETDTLSGFDFTAEGLDVEPGVWREVPSGVDQTGIIESDGPLTYHCTF
ncbi:MAG: hypothetical protein ACRDVM_00280 [Acidimicrobiia bacterium]